MYGIFLIDYSLIHSFALVFIGFFCDFYMMGLVKVGSLCVFSGLANTHSVLLQIFHIIVFGQVLTLACDRHYNFHIFLHFRIDDRHVQPLHISHTLVGSCSIFCCGHISDN